jgi:hypothetical protein
MKLFGLISASRLLAVTSSDKDILISKDEKSKEIHLSFVERDQNEFSVIPQLPKVPRVPDVGYIKLHAVFDRRDIFVVKAPFWKKAPSFERPPKVLGQNHRKKSKQTFYRRTR